MLRKYVMAYKWARAAYYNIANGQSYSRNGNAPSLHHYISALGKRNDRILVQELIESFPCFVFWMEAAAMKRLFIVEAAQNVINHSRLWRPGRNRAGYLRCPTYLFTGLNPSLVKLNPMPMNTYCKLQALSEEMVRSIVDATRLHEFLELSHKGKYRQGMKRLAQLAANTHRKHKSATE